MWSVWNRFKFIHSNCVCTDRLTLLRCTIHDLQTLDTKNWRHFWCDDNAQAFCGGYGLYALCTDSSTHCWNQWYNILTYHSWHSTYLHTIVTYSASNCCAGTNPLEATQSKYSVLSCYRSTRSTGGYCICGKFCQEKMLANFTPALIGEILSCHTIFFPMLMNT